MALIKCAECEKEISDKATTCPSCGCPMENADAVKPKVTTQTQPPLVQPQKKKGHGCLIAVVVFLFLTFIVGTMARTGNSSTNNANASSTNETKLKLSKDEQKIKEATGFSEEETVTIFEALKSCGVETISDIVYEDYWDGIHEEGETGYRITSGNIKNIILYTKADHSVNMICYAENDLYADNEVKSTIADYTFTYAEKAQLETKIESLVKDMLKSPSTAKFASVGEWKYGKRDGKIYVDSYVDSQNSFGAMLRSEFQITIEKESNTITSFIFDGQELMSQQ